MIRTDRDATPTTGVIEAVDQETCVLLAGANTLDELAVHLALFGFPFHVHEPPELIDHLRALAQRVSAAIE